MCGLARGRKVRQRQINKKAKDKRSMFELGNRRFGNRGLGNRGFEVVGCAGEDVGSGVEEERSRCFIP